MTTTALLRVKVTQDHIAKGKREACDRCPIALALKDAGYRADVYAHEVWFDTSSITDVQTSDLPKEAAKFVYAFDGGNEVQPFEFDLEVPVEE